MTERAALILMSTAGCSLCEAALDLLFSMPEVASCSLRVIDVADDAMRMERFGARIPVLVSGERELDGPLTRESVRSWLASGG